MSRPTQLFSATRYFYIIILFQPLPKHCITFDQLHVYGSVCCSVETVIVDSFVFSEDSNIGNYNWFKDGVVTFVTGLKHLKFLYLRPLLDVYHSEGKREKSDWVIVTKAVPAIFQQCPSLKVFACGPVFFRDSSRGFVPYNEDESGVVDFMNMYSSKELDVCFF